MKLQKGKKNKEELSEIFDIDGKEERNEETIANKFNEYFNNIGPRLANLINSEESHKKFLSEKTYPEFTFSKITTSDLLNINKSLKAKAS